MGKGGGIAKQKLQGFFVHLPIEHFNAEKKSV